MVLINFIVVIMGRKSIVNLLLFTKEVNNSVTFLLKLLVTSRKVGGSSKFYRILVILYLKRLKERVGSFWPLRVLAMAIIRILLVVKKLNCKLRFSFFRRGEGWAR